jgi:hypothetical protein
VEARFLSVPKGFGRETAAVIPVTVFGQAILLDGVFDIRNGAQQLIALQNRDTIGAKLSCYDREGLSHFAGLKNVVIFPWGPLRIRDAAKA